MTDAADNLRAPTRTVTEFWVSSGHHMTHRTTGGGLAVTDELILAYLARPELVPPAEACEAERALHADLLREPRRPVSAAMIAGLADADARENWTFMIGFRDRLIAAKTVEAGYAAIIRAGAAGMPPLFLNQMVHLILRNALDGCEDPFVLRAAECFFRPQKASLRDETLLLADLDLVEGFEEERRALMHSSPLAAMMGKEAGAELEVMTDENAASYWSASDAFGFAMNLGANPRTRDALARTIETWVRHMLGVEVRVEPVARVEDQDWRWFVGLTQDGTAIGNALWKGETLDPTAGARIAALFRLDFADAGDADARLAGHPVYLIMALADDMTLRIKPQNLLNGLPLARRTS